MSIILYFVNSDTLNFKTNYIANYIYLLQAAHICPVIGHFYMQHIPKAQCMSIICVLLILTLKFAKLITFPFIPTDC